MTMDYGGSRLPDRSMYENAVSAAEAAHRQLTGLYRDAGSELGSETVWRKIGLTPMIGQNDIARRNLHAQGRGGTQRLRERQGRRPPVHVVPEP